MKRLIKLLVIGLIAVAVLALGAFWYLKRNHAPQVLFRTVSVERGDLVATISATGTVEPEEVIDVGAQVAGRIVAFGKDRSGKTIDYGSFVEQGTVLAQIDDSLYSAEVAQVKAQLEQAKAGILRAEADLEQLQAKLFQAERDWKRAKKLGPSEALSESDYDASVSGYQVAKANLAVGKAALVQAKDAVTQIQATLKRAQQNLDYCTIKSPVKGVIIDRRVNIGQTVVASLNAPSLFLIAKDLKRMQVWVAVNEADTGSIRPGQAVTFTVDAHPGEVFQGEVGKIRLNASMTQNVVTYTVEVITDNSSGKLLPYLTANVKFILSRRNNALRVPNAALRWAPQPEQIAPDSRGRQGSGAMPAAGDSRAANPVPIPPEGYAPGVVWVPSGPFVRPIPIQVGLTDGTMTEILGQGIQEGSQVVIGEQRKDAPKKETQGSSSAPSPFTPQLPGRGRPPARP